MKIHQFGYKAFATLIVTILPAVLHAAAPYPQSNLIENISWDFANLKRLAPGSDLWPVTWGADGHIYTAFGDGGGFGGDNSDGRVSNGISRIEGTPENFVAINVNGGKNAENPATWACTACGKSIGLISVNGIIYSWFNMEDVNPPSIQLGWSGDNGISWTMASWKFPGGSGLFFPNTFLNYGKDNAGAIDEYIYSYGRSWDKIGDVELVRVSAVLIEEEAHYEWFSGIDGNDNPMWSKNRADRVAVFTDSNSNRPASSVVYNPALNTFILTTPHSGVGQLGVFDSKFPWGPWTTISYEDNWGGYGTKLSLYYYFPTKWISADGKTMWMIFSSTGILDSFNLVKGTLTVRSGLPTSPTGVNLNIQLD